MPDASAGPCAKVEWPKAHEVTTVTPESPGTPRAMALRLISCPPRRSGFLVTVASGLRFVCTRSGRRASADLTPASRRQDNTTSPYPAAPVVCAPFDRSRASLNGSPALQPALRAGTAASTASRPALVTIAKRPSEWDGTARDIR